MPHGFPSSQAVLFPNDKPPTLFHPASPKIKPAEQSKQSEKDVDNASMMSTSTFASTVSLIKGTPSSIKHSIRNKLPTSYKEHKARKEAAAKSTVISEGEEVKEQKPKREPWKDTKTQEEKEN